MSRDSLDPSEMRTRLSNLEEENHGLRDEIEVLKSELSQKTIVLNQTNSELQKLQKSYQEELDKIVELSKKTSDRRLLPEEERIYRLQLAEQASCISTLQDRLWDSENQRRFAMLHSSSSNSFDQGQQIYSTSSKKCNNNHNNNYNNNYSYNYNYNQETNSISNCRRSSFCDPIPNIDKAEKKIISLHHKLLEVSKQNDYFIGELNEWSKFVMQIFNIASEALDEYPSFPSDDPCCQRKIALHVVCKLAKAQKENPKLYEKYTKIKEKYQELRHYLSAIEKRCDHLSQVTQLKATNTNNYANINQNSDFNDGDFSYYQKKKYYKAKGSSNPHVQYQIEDFDTDSIDQQSSRKSFSKYKFDEKKIENYSKNKSIDIDDESDQFLNEKNEKLNCNRKSYFKSNEYIKKDSDFSVSDSKNLMNKQRANQTKCTKRTINTEKAEKIMNPNYNNKSDQNKSSEKIHKQVKHQISTESSKQYHYNNTYPKGRPNIDDDNDALYSNFGANLSRLSKITKNMKNDYYDFAKLSKEIDTESYSNEEISKIKSS